MIQHENIFTMCPFILLENGHSQGPPMYFWRTLVEACILSDFFMTVRNERFNSRSLQSSTQLVHIAQPTIKINLCIHPQKAVCGTILVLRALSRETKGFNTDAGFYCGFMLGLLCLPPLPGSVHIYLPPW
ncbi:unnamed protein product [Ectocarpus sp. 8 AP-2014]